MQQDDIGFKQGSPAKQVRLSVTMPNRDKTPRRRSLLVAGESISSSVSTDTRMSRINNQPIHESPIFSAREWYRSSSLESAEIFPEDMEEKATVAAALFGQETTYGKEDPHPRKEVISESATTTTNVNNQTISRRNPLESKTDEGDIRSLNESDQHSTHKVIDDIVNTPSGLKRTQVDVGPGIESTKALFAERLNKTDASFFEENPIRSVPRFIPSELSLGDQIGEGEFGSVYEIESLERKTVRTISDPVSPSMETTSPHPTQEDGDESSFVHKPATTFLPIASKVNAFFRRQTHVHPEDLTSVTENETQDTNSSSSQTNSNYCVLDAFQNIHDNQRSRDHSEISLEENVLTDQANGSNQQDCKGQMIYKQNHEENFDGYVVKVVKGDIHNERRKRVAAADIAAEAKILTALAHPNIIRIRGIMGYIERPGSYGIIMDKLRSTLQDQINVWAKITKEDNVSRAAPENRILEKIPTWLLINKDTKEKQTQLFRQNEFFFDRIEAVADVAQAMKYLHEKKIIFRDLKPENVGLTQKNYVLFDFGLSRYLTDSDKVDGSGENDQYHATGLTGSRLFMAPEVARSKPYGFSADVFSFAILFWEVISLKGVFPTMTMNKHFHLVIVKGKRPESLKQILTPELNTMMEDSWAANPSKRPTFASICDILANEIEKHQSSIHALSHHLLSLRSNATEGSDCMFADHDFDSNERSRNDRRLDMLMNGQSNNSSSFRSKLSRHFSQFENTLEKIKESVDEKIFSHLPSPESSRSNTPPRRSMAVSTGSSALPPRCQSKNRNTIF